MKAIKKRTVTIIVGILVAMSAVMIGTSLAASQKATTLSLNKEIPTVNLLDLNKVLYVLFSK